MPRVLCRLNESPVMGDQSPASWGELHCEETGRAAASCPEARCAQAVKKRPAYGQELIVAAKWATTTSSKSQL